MFDFRYHALSLAAVLFALALGVLLGVAIGDSNLVSSAKSGIVHNLNSEVSQARHQAGQLQEKLTDEEAFANGLYPLAMHELLAGRNIGLLFLGGSSDQINALVRSSVTQAGGQVATVVAVREPLNLEGVAKDAAGTHFATLASSPQLVERFGELVGRQLVSGGVLVDRELLSRVRASLLSAFDGQLTRLEGLVVVRSEPQGMTAEQSEASSRVRCRCDQGHRRRRDPRRGRRGQQHRALAGDVVSRKEPVQRRRSRHPGRTGGARVRARR